MRPVAIIGGGISGLSTAYYLTKAGIPATLVERQPRLGGVIQTNYINGCVLESGPDSFISIKPAALELIRELGLGNDVIGSNDHLRVTYVWKGGKLVPLPDGLMMMVPTKITPLLRTSLLSWSTKFRMALELFRMPSSASGQDRSVAEFIRDHYGDEAVDYLAEPLLSGIYGGDPKALSVLSVLPRFVELEAKYGSLTRGVLAGLRAAKSRNNAEPIFRTLKGGLSSLVQALEEQIRGKVDLVQSSVLGIEREGAGFRVRLEGDTRGADHVVLACQAYQAGALVGSLDAELGALLNAVPYSSSVTIALGYEKSAFARELNGFGFLVPKKERGRLAACTWVGTKFSHRVPDDRVVLRCFVGGTDEAVLGLDDAALLAVVRDEIGYIMGVTAEPAFTQIARWPRSMAQYTVGHQDRMKIVDERLAKIPGLYVAGNAYTGIGIPDCIRMGKQAAERIRQRQS